MELYRKYRPDALDQVYGQDVAVATLQSFLDRNEVPHALLWTGGSGIGKTTLARILAKLIGCERLRDSDNDYDHTDLQEINAAESRGIETIRGIGNRLNIRAVEGDCRVWIIDECHQLTKEAQSALLKMLEEPPNHVYFFLCTTDPQKLLPTIRTRCTEVKLKTLPDEMVGSLTTGVAEAEGVALDDGVREKIIELAQGSARKALVLLGSVIGFPDVDDQMRTLDLGDSATQAIDLARALIGGNGWHDIADKIKRMEDDNWEGIRHLMLSYASTCLLTNNKQIHRRSSLVLDRFRDNWFDSKKAGLVLACYEVTHAPR